MLRFLRDYAVKVALTTPIFTTRSRSNHCNFNIWKGATGVSWRPFYSVDDPEECPFGLSL